MPFVETKAFIRGDSGAIFDIIKNMAAYPSFMEDLVSVDILEQGDNYDISHWISNVDGRRIEWTERDDFYPDDLKITYAQIEGDLKKMEGQWLIEPEDGGCCVTLSVDFEFGIPMIAGLLNPILKKKVCKNSENMLNSIREQIEKKKES